MDAPGGVLTSLASPSASLKWAHNHTGLETPHGERLSRRWGVSVLLLLAWDVRLSEQQCQRSQRFREGFRTDPARKHKSLFACLITIMALAPHPGLSHFAKFETLLTGENHVHLMTPLRVPEKC